MQLIETSAITGHFSDNNLEVYLDIFSCKPFEQHDAIAVVKKYFAPQTIRAAFVDRGGQQPLSAPFKELGTNVANVT